MKAPTTAELIEAVRERMDEAVERPIGGFEARVVSQCARRCEREFVLGPDVAVDRVALLADFDAVDDEALAASIRSGAHDGQAEELRARLLVLAEMQLDIDNPRWVHGSGTD